MVESSGLFAFFGCCCYVSAPTKNLSSTEAGTWAQVFTTVPYVTCPSQPLFRREPLRLGLPQPLEVSGAGSYLPSLGTDNHLLMRAGALDVLHSLGTRLLCLPDSRGRTFQSAAVPGRPVHAGLAWTCARLISLPRTRPSPTVTAQTHRNHLPSSGVSPAVLTSQPGSGFCS